MAPAHASDPDGGKVGCSRLAALGVALNTGLPLRPGVPAVLGGPSTGNKGEVYAVILVGR